MMEVVEPSLWVRGVFAGRRTTTAESASRSVHREKHRRCSSRSTTDAAWHWVGGGAGDAGENEKEEKAYGRRKFEWKRRVQTGAFHVRDRSSMIDSFRLPFRTVLLCTVQDYCFPDYSSVYVVRTP